MSQQNEMHTAYSMVLEWDPEGQIYVVDVPELPGCHTHGRTRVEAVRRGQDAIESWINAARTWGRPIPLPRSWTDVEGASDQRETVAHAPGS